MTKSQKDSFLMVCVNLWQPGLNVITELIIVYMYLGKSLANVAFKTYSYVSMIQALSFLSDFKLGHYMKIPRKSIFIVQLVETIVASTVCYSKAWWLLSSVDHICKKNLLPKGSPWTCPNDVVFYNASIIWGVVESLRMFTSHGIYPQMNWLFLIGVLPQFQYGCFHTVRARVYVKKRGKKNANAIE
ncbi:oligopeptide transporter 1-like [Mangifera indica]|uniref:oligopeptide transporter 1-like n=1 Tax=Mangifera indica TaxID=29780 RepID=UPI001CFC221C|nr:oligopeptide transporter 1-like [Mangifera indica]XP_044474387.1 oligopeptide transporter 1-like [Mangifera indica]